jgi:hypothetical protein
LPIDKMRHEIDDGIAEVGAALGDPRGVAPFFRVPGLARSDVLENELAARSLVVFSSDTVADDWHHRIKPIQIVTLALRRLEARGRGILLLHDIHPTTVAALPGLLKELKDNGFHVVQVVPATSDHIEMANTLKPSMLASAMPEQLTIDDDAAQPIWPHANDSVAPNDIALPVPDASAFEPDAGLNLDTGELRWPDRPAISTASATPETPAPSAKKFGMRTSRHNLDATGSINHEHLRPDQRHAHPRARARADADDHPTDVMSRIKAFATLFSPAQPAH